MRFVYFFTLLLLHFTTLTIQPGYCGFRNRQHWNGNGNGQRWNNNQGFRGNYGFNNHGPQRPGQGHNQQFQQFNSMTCSPPDFSDDASFEVEGCQQNNRNHGCNWGRIPVGWKGTMTCRKGYATLKYTTNCSEEGSWNPPFPETCLELIEHQGFQPANQQQTTDSQVAPSRLSDCQEFRVRLTTNFILTCLLPGETQEIENCFSRHHSVPSGTKVFLKCKPPYKSADGSVEPVWQCHNGNWPTEANKLLCVYSYITGKPYNEGGFNKQTTQQPTYYQPQPNPWNPNPNLPHKTTSPATTPRPQPNPWTTKATTQIPVYTTGIPVIPSTIPPMREINCPALPKPRPEVRLECVFMGEGVSKTKCDTPMPKGTEAKYSCEDYHESTFEFETMFRKCKEDGTWSGGSGFSCVPKCGLANVIRVPYITNGLPTVRGQWPWHSAIFLQSRKTNQWSFICGATLISKKALLTAAHCVTLFQTTETREKTELRVDLGKYEREQTDDLVQVKRVLEIVVHPSYNPYGYDSDIALIILDSEIQIGYHVRPICFPETSDTALEDIQLTENSIGTVVGWGYDENRNLANALRMAKLKVIGRHECSQSIAGSSASPIQTRSTTYCAGFQNGTNVCNGDSGGGMYFNSKDSDELIRWYLQGIVSVGIADEDGKCDPKQYSVFTRVGRYSDWITRTLTENDAI